MARTSATIMLVAGSLALAPGAKAGFTYLTQSRYVSANAVSGAVTDAHTITSPTFGVFDAMVTAQAFNPETGFSGFGSANQTSSLDPLEIIASGGWTGRRDGQAGLPGGGGTSSFSVTFILDQPADFRFEASSSFQLFFIFTGAGPGGGLDIRQSGVYTGTLVPGPYALDVVAMGSGGFPAGFNGFSVHLTIPSPAAAMVLAAWGLCGVRRRRG